MTNLNVPNNLTNGSTADATDVQQNFDAIETHVNTELLNRDGSIAMTGELLLPSNPTSNLAASTKSYVDGKDSAMNTRVTTLEGTDITITLTGDVTGAGTITNLGNVSFAAAVTDDSHNHVVGNIDDFTENVQDIVGAMVSGNTESGGIAVTYQNADGTLDFVISDDGHDHTIANVDGLQNALDGKLGSTAKAADSDKLDNLNSTQFLRSDTDDTMTGTLTVGGTGKYLRIKDTVNNTHTLTFATADMSSNRTITFPNSSGTVSLDGHTHSYASTSHTHSYAATSHSHSYLPNSGRATTITGCSLTGNSWLDASFIIRSDGTGTTDSGQGVSMAFGHSYSGTFYGPQIRAASDTFFFRQAQNGDSVTIDVYKLVTRSPSLNSSRTIKENINDFSGATTVVDSLRPVSFSYIDGDGQTCVGLIAEEVAEVLPIAVSDVGETPTLNLATVVGVAVAGLKEANARISELEAQVAALSA